LKESNLLGESPLKKNQILVIPPRPADDRHLSETEFHPEEPQLTLGQRVAEEARRFLNTPYRLGGDNWWGIDCSGLVKQVYEAVGLKVPATSTEQFRHGQPISLTQAKPGDLVFFSENGRINHVGIYLGNEEFIHASSLQQKVTVASLANDYFRRKLVGIRRYLTGQNSPASFLAKEQDNVDTP
ncbi:MAG: C40 family peptidase, partial [Candidatus Omnitrophica bacterium]|nr:C40 family peptidase [Candidatus Omnitrophota bacterium]